MKRIGITQRVEIIERYHERRDCLDQRWSDLCFALECLPCPLPNTVPENVPALLDALNLDAVILSGGNSIACLDPAAPHAAPERDAFEASLIDEALKRNIPVLGVCRGMQMINLHFGGELIPVEGHVGLRHTLSVVDGNYPLAETVNSYHDWGIAPQGLGPQLKPIAVDSDGNIEAFQHSETKIFGIMWHPEREPSFSSLDMQLIKRFLL